MSVASYAISYLIGRSRRDQWFEYRQNADGEIRHDCSSEVIWFYASSSMTDKLVLWSCSPVVLWFCSQTSVPSVASGRFVFSTDVGEIIWPLFEEMIKPLSVRKKACAVYTNDVAGLYLALGNLTLLTVAKRRCDLVLRRSELENLVCRVWRRWESWVMDPPKKYINGDFQWLISWMAPRVNPLRMFVTFKEDIFNC